MMRMPDSLSCEGAAPLAVAAAAAAIIVYLLAGRRRGADPRDPRLPPLCEHRTWKEMSRLFNGPGGPHGMLRLRREMGCADFEVPIFPWQSVTSVPSLYVLTDYKSARKALGDPRSTKFEPFNLFFLRTTHGGHNLVTAEGHRWNHARKSTSAAFSGANLKRMVEPIGSIVEKWIKDVLEPAVKSGAPIDILGEMNQITADVIADVAFDYEFVRDERAQFLADLTTCWEEFGVAANTNVWKQLRFSSPFFPGIWKGKFAARRMYRLCRKLLLRYRGKGAYGRREHKLIDMIAADGEYADDGERCRDMVAYVIAGFDTTANTLSFALRELALHPGEQGKLSDALRECATAEDARNCPRLRMAVKEIVRLYPAAALGSIRQLGADLTLPSTGKVVPKGSLVNTNYFCMQRDPALFDDPDRFVPDRWEDATSEQNSSVLTFSFGRRSCQGQGLALVEMKEILCRLVGRYRFGIAEAGEPQNLVLFKPVGTMLVASAIGPK